jgi:2-polyprenyl-3-methyl-5-hydroxy-6-metoxy-1,4-benzoquinol methylase
MTDAPQDDPWRDAADGWDDDPHVVAYADAAFESLRRAVDLSNTRRVLDFGCGTGLLTERLAPMVREIVAVDASPAMVAILAGKAISTVRTGVATWTPETIDADPLAADPFDLVVCSSVCAFVDDYSAAVAMLATRLLPGGHFVQWDWELDPSAEEPFGLTATGIRGALEAAGLEVLAVGHGFDLAIDGGRMRPLMGVGRRPVETT